MDQEQFYARCAYLLGVKHEYQDPLKPSRFPERHGNIRNTYKSRYNGRTPGNGRFPESGIIRDYGSIIHVSLTTPPLTGQFKSREAALEAIEAAMKVYEEKVEAITREETEAALKQNPVGYRHATPEELDLCRRWTRRVHIECDELLKDRKPRFIDRRMVPATEFLAADIEEAEKIGISYEDRIDTVERMRKRGITDDRIETMLGIKIPEGK